jgi:triphosphoribosyl-dephospho-CoA synthetase
VDAETKESTRKTEEKLDERYKAMNKRNLNEGQWEDRKQYSLGVGQRRKAF